MLAKLMEWLWPSPPPVESLVAAHRPQLFHLPPHDGRWLVLPVRAVDGDTVEVYMLTPVSVRLAEIDAPEKGTEAGKAAAKCLAELLPEVPTVLHIVGRDKYGRVLGHVYFTDDITLSAQLVEMGHARRWDGKGAKP